MHYNNNYSGANPLLPRGFPLMKSELPFYSRFVGGRQPAKHGGPSPRFVIAVFQGLITNGVGGTRDNALDGH